MLWGSAAACSPLAAFSAMRALALLALAAVADAWDVNATGASAGCGSAPPVYPGAPAAKLAMWAPDANPLFPDGYAQRHYFLWVPPTYDPKQPASLVVDFHGFYDNAGDEVEESGLIAVATAAGLNYVVVYPVGSGGGGSGDSRSWNVDGNGLNRDDGPGGPVCRLPRAASRGRDDVREIWGGQNNEESLPSCSVGRARRTTSTSATSRAR